MLKFKAEEVSMRHSKLILEPSSCAPFSKLAAAALFLALSAGFPVISRAQQAGQKTFSSAEEASTALVTAAQNNDLKALLEILGPDGKEIVSSGDETEDAENRANFARRYEELHRLVKEPDGTTTLYIGAENWPWPIPFVNKGNVWYLDTEAGKKEILYRRVGRNEMSAIMVCRQLVAAQRDYYDTQNQEYAQKIFSDAGKPNGLYWKAADGTPESPVGPLVASAAEDYVKSQEGGRTPYRGYYYNILTRQGKNAPGGAKNYVVDGKMTAGFAFVAYPAEYGSSGVMTFIVNQDGVVYQKDFGSKTAALAKAAKEYNPGPGWERADTMQDEAAAGQAP
jgi:hypothetical protein